MSDYSLDDQAYTYTNTYTEDADTSNASQKRKRSIPIVIIIAIGFVLFLLLFFLLFQNTSTNNQQGQSDDQNLTGNILWRGVFLDKKIIDQLLTEYKKIRPNVNVIYENVWNNSLNQKNQIVSYQNDLNRVVGSANQLETPDIFMVKNTWVGDYESRSLPHPSRTKQSISLDYYPFVAEDFARSGGVYGLPLWVDTFTILYNRNLVEQGGATSSIPSSLDTFQTFTNGFSLENIFPFAMGYPANTSFAFEFFQILMRMEGIDFSANEGDLTNNFDLQRFRNAFIFFRNFSNTWSNLQNNDSSAFLRGDVAMIFSPSYRLREILRFNDLRDLNINIDIAEIPSLNQKHNVGDYWGLMVSRNSLNGKIAWDLIDWLSQDTQLKLLHNLVKEENKYFGTIYPKRELNNELKNDPYLAKFVTELDHVKTWYQIKGTEISKAFENLLRGNNIDNTLLLNLNNEIRRLQQRKGVFSEITL